MAKNRPKEIEVVSREQLFAKGPFSINEINCRHELFQGGMSEPFPWMVFERGDAVAVVLYRRDIHQIVLVRQFRAPTLRFGDNPHVPINDGYLDEIIAGKPNAEDNLDYRACAMREVREETGYILQAGDLEEISRFYVSSGGTSERIILYFAEVTDRALAPNAAEIQGKSEDNENILVRHIPVSDFLAMTDVGEAAEDAIDSKILIASLLLRDRLRNVPREQREVADSIAVPYQLSDNAERRIILRAGHLGRVEDVPIWVNAESTDMELDRYSGTSMSSFIRFNGAVKNGADIPIEDTIGNALRKARRGARIARLGTIHRTKSGELLVSNGVKSIYHVASAPGVTGHGASARVSDVRLVTTRVLERISEKESGRLKKQPSVLFPIIGTGEQGLTVETAFPAMLDSCVDFLQSPSSDRIKDIHIWAKTKHDAHQAIRILDAHKKFKKEDIAEAADDREASSASPAGQPLSQEVGATLATAGATIEQLIDLEASVRVEEQRRRRWMMMHDKPFRHRGAGRPQRRPIRSLLIAGGVTAAGVWSYYHFFDHVKEFFDGLLGFGLLGRPMSSKAPAEVTVFASKLASPGQYFQIQFFVHLPVWEQREEAAELAEEIDPDASRRARQPLLSKIPKGAKVTFLLTSDEQETRVAFGLENVEQAELIWREEPVSASIFSRVSQTARNGEHLFKVIVTANGAPAGELQFKVTTTEDSGVETNWSTRNGAGLSGLSTKKYGRIFMSYAREDLQHVQTVARAYDALDQRFFWDIESLRSGDVWEQELYEAIEQSDAFLLFWSESAKASDMVKKEVTHALSCESDSGSPSFIPFPIEGPPIPDPWDEIAFKHIGDPMYFRNASSGTADDSSSETS